jgi:hypothetical protein
MIRIYSLIVALVLCLSACSGPPPRSAAPTTNVTDDTALVDNAGTTDNTATPADNSVALPEGVTKGVGAFVDPGDMDVDAWSTLEFVVGPTEAVIAEETEGRKLTPSAAVYVAPTMRVTLLPDPGFQYQPQSDPIQDTGQDRTATWQWKVKPLTGGTTTLFARVEVGERERNGTLNVVKTYTRRVAVHVHVGTWKGFLNALKSAASLGDLIGTLVGSLGKTLTAIAAMVTAGPTVWLAFRSWRKRKDAKAADSAPAAATPPDAKPDDQSKK